MLEDPIGDNTFMMGQKQEAGNNRVISSKYTMLTFLPYNIYHQLSKPSTCFFFVTLILISIPVISPFEPYTYMIAFLIVVGISMVKDGLEDYRRHKNDREMNEMECTVIEDGVLVKKAVMNLSRGDWLYLHRDEEVAADVVFVRGQLVHKKKLCCLNYCFVETSNLDGESNLKKRSSAIGYKPCNSNMNTNTIGNINTNVIDNLITNSNTSNTNSIDTNNTNNTNIASFTNIPICTCFTFFDSNLASFNLKDTGESFSDFKCDIHFRNQLLTATEKSVLLRGSILKNTERAICLVVGVGNETKQCRSIYKARKGKSLFESKMDHILFIVFILYAAMLIVTAVLGSFKNSPKEVLKLIFSNYIIYSYLVPLSLYVMVEVSRFFHSSYIKYDRSMKMGDMKSVCRNSNVIEDLGIIDYILTDKTGTLTKNSMTLKKFHIPGRSDLINYAEYLSEYNNKYNIDDNKFNDKDIIMNTDILFIINLLVCNSVEVLSGHYEAISQDELCFLKSIKEFGFVLSERDDNYVIIKLNGNPIRINIIATYEFSSKRQRMSVIVDILGELYIFSKGSDHKLLDPVKDRELLKILNRSCDYRSLVLSYSKMGDDNSGMRDCKYDNIKMGDNKDNKNNKDRKIEYKDNDRKLFKRLHQNMTYLGSTFIEDELQDDVANTMSLLRKAGLKVWMVTGDKKETAVSCGRNSGIIRNNSFIDLEGHDALRLIEAYINTNINDINNDINNIFAYDSVIIHRATPPQKGKIASLMVKANKHTLSIGDGNNDVAMLKDSHVGVGIMGKEGTQASLAADFAIPQFKLLSNLILIHGRYNLIRYSKIALNSFYKNIFFIFIQFFYNLYNGASGRPIYNQFFMNYYNLFFTSLIPFSIALFDRDSEHILQHPESYQKARLYFDRKYIYSYIIYGIIEAAFVFFSIRYFIYWDISGMSGKLGGYPCASTLFSMVIFFSVILRQVRYISYIVIYNYIAIGLSILFNMIMLFGLQELSVNTNNTIYHILSMPVFYIIIFGLSCLVYMLDTIFNYIQIRIYEHLVVKK